MPISNLSDIVTHLEAETGADPTVLWYSDSDHDDDVTVTANHAGYLVLASLFIRATVGQSNSIPEKPTAYHFFTNNNIDRVGLPHCRDSCEWHIVKDDAHVQCVGAESPKAA